MLSGLLKRRGDSYAPSVGHLGGKVNVDLSVTYEECFFSLFSLSVTLFMLFLYVFVFSFVRMPSKTVEASLKAPRKLIYQQKLENRSVKRGVANDKSDCVHSREAVLTQEGKSPLDIRKSLLPVYELRKQSIRVSHPPEFAISFWHLCSNA